MASVCDVAVFIKRESGASGMRLHKLLYYAQAWSLVWDHAPLFPERLEAWREGPVSSHVYGDERHEGGVRGDVSKITEVQSDTVRAVLGVYGKKSGDWLSRLTHREEPWRLARRGLPPDAPSKTPISIESMLGYYSAAPSEPGKQFSPAYLRGLDMLVEMPEEEIDLLRDKSAVDAEPFLRWLETGAA